MMKMFALLATVATAGTAVPAVAATQISITARNQQYTGSATFIGNRNASGGINLSDLTSATGSLIGDMPTISFALSDLTWFSFRSESDYEFAFAQGGSAFSGDEALYGANFPIRDWSGNTVTLFLSFPPPFSISVTEVATPAIPEPATWAMMLVGFGMVAATARYRRRSTRIVHA